MQAEPMALFIEAWKQMTGLLPTPQHREESGVSSCFCDVDNLFFNLWFQSAPVQDEQELREILRAGKARGESSKHPAGGILRGDWMPDGWEAVLAEEGLSVMMDMVGMETAEIVPPPRELAKLDIRPIADDEAAMHAAMINAHAYAMPEEQFAPCGGMHFYPAGVLGFIGYADGKPVATAGVKLVNDTAYVFLVATEPEEQGKGYAAATMRHAMDEGRRLLGRELLTLHATMGGSKTYEKMGFAAGPATPLVIPAQ